MSFLRHSLNEFISPKELIYVKKRFAKVSKNLTLIDTDLKIILLPK